MKTMEFTNPDTDVYVPGGAGEEEALARTTHLAIGAHQDDIEFMALHGILECVDREDRWFTGVTLTDGSGSARTGPYAECTEQEMRQIRIDEQRRAARVGAYGCQIQLLYASADIKDGTNPGPVADLGRVLSVAQPEIVYLHNPADRHDTHVACLLRSLTALRNLAQDRLPRKVYGCEVWRDLDWLTGEDKQVLPLADPHGLGVTLSGLFDSQISGGKRYDLAVQGRRRAHATFFESHEADTHELLTFAMDLTPLIKDRSADVTEFTLKLLRRTQEDVRDRIARMS
jgi:LmbE family N-acetylglucosaminyl deacetylase